MSPSANAADSVPSLAIDSTEKNLQPFYVLHKPSSQRSDGRSNGTVKPRRKIDLSPSKRKVSGENFVVDDSRTERLRMEAYQLVWSKMETTIKNVLKEINSDVFDEIYRWISESFNFIRTIGTPSSRRAIRTFPLVVDANSKHLFTGFVLTKNVEFVDDLLTFEELGLHLKSHGCYVAKLSALDFLSKNGIGGCLRRLLRQFLMITFDAPELSILASWYAEQVIKSPMVVIIEDLERSCGTVLSELVIMLSEWAVKIPIVLLMGVTTTLDAPKTILSSRALQLLNPSKFILGLPSERMDAVVEAILLRQCSMISVGHKVADFLRNYFLNQDGTLTSFIRGLKIACVQHFCSEPLSFMLAGFDRANDENDNKAFSVDDSLKHASEIMSHPRYQMSQHSDKNVEEGLLELKRLRNRWSAIVLCLYEAGKSKKLPLLDILCEALDKDLYKPMTSENIAGSGKRLGTCPSSACAKQHCFIMRKDGFISQAVNSLRGIPVALLCQLLLKWEKHTVNFPEVHCHLRELQSALEFDEKRSLQQDLSDLSKRHAFQPQLRNQGTKSVNDKVVTVLNLIVREYLRPIECIPFHEVISFKEVEKLKSALIGDPRRRIQRDLLNFHKILKCSCCLGRASTLLPSMQDSSILYILSQEHGDLINLHDWFQSFKQIVLQTSTQKKQKKNSMPKKRKIMSASENKNEALIQARFCRGVTELQITGLLRMPSKRRPDFVQRVAFGL